MSNKDVASPELVAEMQEYSPFNAKLRRALDVARQYGGVCLSTTVVPGWDKMSWRCASGHEFEMTAHEVCRPKKFCHACDAKKPPLDLARAAAGVERYLSAGLDFLPKELKAICISYVGGEYTTMLAVCVKPFFTIGPMCTTGALAGLVKFAASSADGEPLRVVLRRSTRLVPGTLKRAVHQVVPAADQKRHAAIFEAEWMGKTTQARPSGGRALGFAKPQAIAEFVSECSCREGWAPPGAGCTHRGKGAPREMKAAVAPAWRRVFGAASRPSVKSLMLLDDVAKQN